jgi:hypothetical protein
MTAEYNDRWWKPLRPNCESTYTQPIDHSRSTQRWQFDPIDGFPYPPQDEPREEGWLALYKRDPQAARAALGCEPAGKGGYYDRSKPWTPEGHW